jgi:hypothetical protein
VGRLLYFDFGQEEILIGAALSGDQNLLATYAAKDPYVKFGHDSGVLKPQETKETAPAKRDACKVFMLAVGYGMQTATLAKKINADVPGMNLTEFEASDLIYKHKRLYEVYWNWVGAYVEEALISGVVYTASGWAMHVMPKRNTKHPNWTPEINLRAIGNFPVQGTGSDILRATCINLCRDIDITLGQYLWSIATGHQRRPSEARSRSNDRLRWTNSIWRRRRSWIGILLTLPNQARDELCCQTLAAEIIRMTESRGSRTRDGTSASSRRPMKPPAINPAAITRTKLRF